MKRNVLVFLVALSISCIDQKSKNRFLAKENNSNKKILFVLTSNDKMGNTGEKAGFWLEEFCTPYYYLKDKGVEITLVSPKGGNPPIDPRSEAKEKQDKNIERFWKDKEAQDQLAHTLKLQDINDEDFDAVFYPGGHGPLWDLVNDSQSVLLIESFYNSGKVVAAICHGPAVFKHVTDKEGKPIVSGKKVTGFSDAEEEYGKYAAVVPFLVEDMLKKEGGNYSKAEKNWESHVVQDGNLITGQNPNSSEAIAELIYNALKKY